MITSMETWSIAHMLNDIEHRSHGHAEETNNNICYSTANDS